MCKTVDVEKLYRWSVTSTLYTPGLVSSVGHSTFGLNTLPSANYFLSYEMISGHPQRRLSLLSASVIYIEIYQCLGSGRVTILKSPQSGGFTLAISNRPVCYRVKAKCISDVILRSNCRCLKRVGFGTNCLLYQWRRVDICDGN